MAAGPRREGESFPAYRQRLKDEERWLKDRLRPQSSAFLRMINKTLGGGRHVNTAAAATLLNAVRNTQQKR